MASDRYQAGGPQAEWQPGANGQVLRNKPGITDAALMDEAELALLLQLYEFVMGEGFPDRRLRVTDLMEWHRLWLGNLYEWAGEGRSVNMAKGDFHFAAAAQIPRLLQNFEREGNGRLSRLLADVMALQAGRGPLDYTQWDADKPSYFGAIRHGMRRDYAPMRELVSLALASPNGSGRG
jgi:cell filamentation protein